jgi:hypothetical protein
VVAINIVVAAVVIAAVPSGIAVEVIVVVGYGATCPITIPGIPSPSATTAVSQSTKSDSCAEADDAGSHISYGVSRSYIWRAIDRGGVVYRDIYDLRVRGFDDDSLRRLLFDCDLRIRRETARGLGFSARNV